MVDRRNNATYIAQKRFNDFTAWRSVPNKILTSSHLANISLPELQKQQQAQRDTAVEFNSENAREFYAGITSGLQSVLDVIDNNGVDADFGLIDQKLFDLKPSLDLFEQSLIASKSSLTLETYTTAVERFREAQRLAEEARRARSNRQIRELTNIVLDQVSRISDNSGAAGRRIANNILNSFLSEAQSTNTARIGAVTSILSEFFPEGNIGKDLLQQAEPIIGAAQNLLKTSTEAFNSETEQSQNRISSTIFPILESIGEITRFLPSNISGEISNITNQITGIASDIDRGLSAVRSDGQQLQPLAGQYGNRSNVRIGSSAQTFSIPNELNINLQSLNLNSTNRLTPGFAGGDKSVLPSEYIQSVNRHPRSSPSRSTIISDRFKHVSPELSNIRFEILDTYRKMPGASLRNPEIANGPSLTTPILEPVIESIVGNTRTGTTVADLVGTVKSAEQIFVPRLG